METPGTNPGEDSSVKNETIELEKEPKLVLEKINVSRSKALLTKNKIEQSIFEQVDEVMNEPLDSDPDNDSGSDYEAEIFSKCKECDKVFKTQQAYKMHRKKYHVAPGNKPGWRQESKKRGITKMKIEEDTNPWNVSNLDDFLHYCCPECDIKHDSRTMFINHAIDEHPKSRQYLSIFGLIQTEDNSNLDHFEDSEEVFEDKFEITDLENGDDIKDDNFDDYETNELFEDNLDFNDMKDEPDNDSGSDYEAEIFSKCKECDKVFKTEQAYKMHRTKLHVAPGNKPGWRQERKKHLENRDDINDYENSELFEDNLELNDMKDKLEQPKVEVKIEQDNDEPSEKKIKLELPKIVYNNKPISRVICLLCNKEFAHERRVLDHHKNIHGRKKPSWKEIETPIQEIKEEPNDESEHKIKCEICNKGLKNDNALRHHMRLHKVITKAEDFVIEEIVDGERVERYACERQDCDKILDSKSLWICHKKIHHKRDIKIARLIAGQKRKEKFREEKLDQFKIEIDPISGQEMYKCYKCDMTFDKVDKIEKHNEWHEIGKEESITAKCFLCEKEFDHKNILAKHMKDNHRNEDDEYKCHRCSRTFKTCQKLELHLIREHEIGEFRYKCDECEKAFASSSSLKKHKRIVHEGQGNGFLNFVCDVCGKFFKTSQALGTHSKIHDQSVDVITHDDILKKCEKCNEEFNIPEIFEDHLKQCLDEQKCFKCRYCDSWWVSHLSLEMHTAVSHQKLNCVCHICGIAFMNSERKANHVKNIHDKNNEFVCHLCAKPCSNKRKFKEHMEVYHGTGEKKFACEHCDLKFYAKNRLTQHVKTKHTRDTIYQCDQCSKKFWAKEYLRDHIKHVHKKYKPNKCDLCSEAYLYKRDLIKHKESVHHIHM